MKYPSKDYNYLYDPNITTSIHYITKKQQIEIVQKLLSKTLGAAGIEDEDTVIKFEMYS